MTFIKIVKIHLEKIGFPYEKINNGLFSLTLFIDRAQLSHSCKAILSINFTFKIKMGASSKVDNN